MNTNPPSDPTVVPSPTPDPAHAPTAAIPSNTFSVSVINTVIASYVESAATLEEIANQCSISIPQVLECLREQDAFLRGLLTTLETRVRIIAARVEAIAIEMLNSIATYGRDSESRRKAASKLLSHFATSKLRATRTTASQSGAPGSQPAASSQQARAPGSQRAASSPHARGTGVPPVPTSSTASITGHPTNEPRA